MRSRRLAEVLASIVAATSATGCSVFDDCDESEVSSRSSRELTVRRDGTIVQPWEDAATPDAEGDAAVGDAAPGADAGAPFDCATPCRSGIMNECGRTELETCSVLSTDPERTVVRCNYAHYPACLPPGAVCGRRPDGFRAGARHGAGLGALFARMASLEAASVPAFRTLRAELRAVGAPRSLLRAATRAKRDEIAHARATARLARRFGSRAAGFEVGPRRARAAVAIAIENAVEGCVRETFGALVATWQAGHAHDPQIRAAMRRIARDETEHAALARRVDRFLLARLGPDDRARVEAARLRAIEELAREVDAQIDDPSLEPAGLPSRAASRALLAGLRARVWPGFTRTPQSTV